MTRRVTINLDDSSLYSFKNRDDEESRSNDKGRGSLPPLLPTPRPICPALIRNSFVFIQEREEMEVEMLNARQSGRTDGLYSCNGCFSDWLLN